MIIPLCCHLPFRVGGACGWKRGGSFAKKVKGAGGTVVRIVRAGAGSAILCRVETDAGENITLAKDCDESDSRIELE
jgi:hypothetical protein